jgi:Fe2+ or Zn2+ uptake regulation protein
MRSSKQRDLVLSIINSQSSHLNADEIYKIARGIMPNIGLGTVYRDLKQLLETKQINAIKTADGGVEYDSVLIKHHYFICEKCGKIDDVYQDFELPVDTLVDYKVLDYDIYFKGICSDCNKEV